MTAPGLPAELQPWPDRLEAAIVGAAHWRRAIVVAETGSTQDAARRLAAVDGDVIVAGRQTAGRGRQGREWLDTADGGVAMTLVLPARVSLHWSAAAALGAAMAAESLGVRGVRLKWPNDVVVGGRKLAGVLVEQSSGLAYIGIGLNVGQACWPPGLENTAVSLRQVGVDADRLEVMQQLLAAVDVAAGMEDGEIVRAWTRRDALRGGQAEFEHRRGLVSGRVLHVDPLRGVLVRTEAGAQWLEAASSRLCRFVPGPGGAG